MKSYHYFIENKQNNKSNMTTRSSSSSSSSTSPNDCEWIVAFNNKLKVRAFEQFSLLLFDKDSNNKDNNEQRQLLRKILFENHQSVLYWYDYINHVINKYPGRKLQLQRLINKAIDCVTVDSNAIDNRTNRHFVNLFLLSAQYKNDDHESIKYFEDVIWKKEIGRRFANVYISWSDIAIKIKGPSEAIAIIQKGIDSQAEPRLTLQTRLQELQVLIDPSIKANAHFDDGEVIFNKNSKIEINHKKEVIDTSNEETTETIEQPTVELKNDTTNIKQSTILSRQPLNSMVKSKAALLPKGLKSNNSLVSSLGKCQRVTVASNDSKSVEISDDSDDEANNQSLADIISFKQPFAPITSVETKVSAKAPIDNEVVFKKLDKKDSSECSDEEITSCGMTATVKLEQTEKISLNGKRKADLSKYIDEKLLNFDPSKRLNANKKINETCASIVPTLLETTPIVTTTNNNDDKENNRITRSSARNCEKKRPNPSTENSVNNLSLDVGVSDKKKRVSFARAADAGLPLNASEISLAEKQKNEIKKKESVVKTTSNENRPIDLTSRIILNGRGYTRLGVLGKGGSSCVYRVLSDDGNLYAYKYVDVRGDSESVFENYTNEIELLRRLKGSPYIIELIDAEVNKDQMYIAMILEIGDVDLAKSLSQKQKVAAMSSSTCLNPFYIRLVWQEMLEAVDHIHENRIVHGDLKPANFVFVKGHLKLIDFGIAKAFSNDTTNIYRESQIGTVNYMAPEAIAPYTDDNDDSSLRMKLGRASDIWSLGCILYQMIYGRPPFASLNTIQKLHAIPNPKNEIKYPPYDDLDAIETMKACLERDPKRRAQIRGKHGLLEYPFLKLNQASSSSSISSHSNNVETKISELTVEGTTEFMEIETPLVAIDDVRKAVQFIMDTANVTLPKGIDKDKLNDIVWRILTHRDEKAEYKLSTQSNVSIFNDDNIQVQNRKLDNDVLQSQKNGLQTMDDIIEKRQPLKVLPNNLMDQIKTSSKALESSEKSTRAKKWMKAKEASPEKQDMRLILERRIADMRQFMEVEQDETSTTYFNGL